MENINQESEINEKPYSPNNPPWNSVAAFMFCCASFLLIPIVQFIFITPYLRIYKINFTSQKEMAAFLMSDPTAAILQIGATIPAHIVTLVLGWFIVTRFNQFSFKEMLGWKWGGFKWWHTILLVVGIYALMFVLTKVFGQQENSLDKFLKSSRYVVFLVAFVATFSAPIVEEVVYRGVLYSAFQKSFGIPIAVVFVTLVFALIHFPQYWGDYSTLIALTTLSLLITMIRVKTNNLLPCILFHFAINAFYSLVLILEPYLPTPPDATKSAEAFFYLI